ncbi:hypothetical protein DFH07DRAFT_1063800 [Mycena maculata]|uniref:F-box domain-containing protein n=1 Tax=Mycena maculata TaxID=230809 RepID=A0AAD7II93_9AGAR|nr:hypothetical protein DFH07DRAFT_1063800 [Mycena maculata]
MTHFRTPVLPPEIWLYIHRLATSETTPLATAQSAGFQYAAPADPLQSIHYFLWDVCSFVLVCRLWNSLANELLYENVEVPKNEHSFSTLSATLERPGTARLVRSIRFSRSRFDHNFAILALCPQVRVVCQPDPKSFTVVFNAAGDLPTFHFLKHVYWTESFKTSASLRAILQAAPNLENLFLDPSPMWVPAPVEKCELPPIPNLRRLACSGFLRASVSYILKLDLQRLTRLGCAPSHIELPDFPTLPVLATLELFGSRQRIQFATLFAHCPRVHTLCYDVWNALVAPDSAPSPPVPLTYVRLHSAVVFKSVRDWVLIERHFDLLLAPEFPRIARLVLEGSWHHDVADVRFARLLDGVRAQGCQLEFPEGFVR